MLVQETLAEAEATYYNDVLDMWMPKYAAYEAGIVVSRQNGKGTYLEARALAGLFLLGERQIAWTAHEMPTAKEGFQRLEALIVDNPEFKREVKHIHYSNGNEGIELKSGQKVIFKTRTKKALRGFTIDCLLMDEAMILDPDMMAAMMFAVSARPNAQLVYTGSAGDENSIQFGRVRKKALTDHEPRTFFAEWSADVCDQMCRPDCDDHDPIHTVETYAKANPGLGYRIEVENIDSERTSMDRERFCRERLSVGTWPIDGNAWAVIPEESWQMLLNEASGPQSPMCLSVDVTIDKAWSCIAVAGSNGEGRTHVEVTHTGVTYDHRMGTKWVVPRIREICKNNKIDAIVIDRGSQAAEFYDELEAYFGSKVLTPTTREYAEACGSFFSGVVPRSDNEPTIVHCGQPMLDSAVAGAGKRTLADLWAWDKRNSSSDISPLVAVTNAAWGHRKLVNRPKPKPKAAWG